MKTATRQRAILEERLEMIYDRVGLALDGIFHNDGPQTIEEVWKEADRTCAPLRILIERTKREALRCVGCGEVLNLGYSIIQIDSEGRTYCRGC
jgi:hypothetical protein